MGSKGPDGDWVTDSLGIGSHCGETQGWCENRNGDGYNNSIMRTLFNV